MANNILNIPRDVLVKHKGKVQVRFKTYPDCTEAELNQICDLLIERWLINSDLRGNKQ